MKTRPTFIHSFSVSFALFAGLAAAPAMAQPADHDHGQHAPAKADAPQSPQPDSKPATKDAAKDKRVGDPYPLATCPITGEKLGSMGEPVVKVYESAGGREVRFCCKSCPPKFEKDLAASFTKLDEQIIKDRFYDEVRAPLRARLGDGHVRRQASTRPCSWTEGTRLTRLHRPCRCSGHHRPGRRSWERPAFAPATIEHAAPGQRQ